MPTDNPESHVWVYGCMGVGMFVCVRGLFEACDVSNDKTIYIHIKYIVGVYNFYYEMLVLALISISIY